MTSVLYIYGRQASDTCKLEASKVDVGNTANYGGQEVIIILKTPSFPIRTCTCWARSTLPACWWNAAGYHRQSYGGCKVGNGDVLIGALPRRRPNATAVPRRPIKDKIIEMIQLNETLFSCGIACSCEAAPHAGRKLSDRHAPANVCSRTSPAAHEIARLAGHRRRLMVTMPSDADFTSDEVGEWCL